MHVTLQNFSDSRYYLAKFKREIDRLREAQSYASSDDVRDHGINAAITAWHLPEWILRKQNAQVSKQEVETLRNAIIQKNGDFALMHDFATQAKHFRVSTPENPTAFEIRTSARAIYTEAETLQINEHLAVNPNESLYMRLTNPIQTILKIDERDALPIFEKLYSLFENIISENTDWLTFTRDAHDNS
jgi:replicative superfamily II helicase